MDNQENKPVDAQAKRTRLLVMGLIIAVCAVILFFVFYNGAAQ